MCGGGDVEGGGGGGGGCGGGGGRIQLLPGRVCDIEPLSLLVVFVTSRLVEGVWRVLVMERTPRGCLVVDDAGDMWWCGLWRCCRFMALEKPCGGVMV